MVAYANEQAAAQGRSIDFSLTTNATLLTPAIIEFLSENRIGVTVSMDGPPGAARQAPRLRQRPRQLRHHRAARARADPGTPHAAHHRARHADLAASPTWSASIRHLKHDLGFHEVGFAPVTTSPNRLYAINERGMDSVLDQFQMLAEEYLEFALRGELHGFSNVSDTLAELYQGVNKSHPCGAGLGLLGVGPSGDIAPCHRFVDSDTHALGHISTGIDRDKAERFPAPRPH